MSQRKPRIFPLRTLQKFLLFPSIRLLVLKLFHDGSYNISYLVLSIKKNYTKGRRRKQEFREASLRNCETNSKAARIRKF